MPIEQISSRIATALGENDQLKIDIELLRGANLELREENARLRAEVEALKAGLLAVQNLIEQSGGVYGLHLNGDPAPWNDLLEGGRYEDWLVDFSAALRGEGEKLWIGT